MFPKLNAITKFILDKFFYCLLFYITYAWKGYGDMVCRTPAGRIFSIFFIVSSVPMWFNILAQLGYFLHLLLFKLWTAFRCFLVCGTPPHYKGSVTYTYSKARNALFAELCCDFCWKFEILVEGWKFCQSSWEQAFRQTALRKDVFAQRRSSWLCIILLSRTSIKVKWYECQVGYKLSRSHLHYSSHRKCEQNNSEMYIWYLFW